MKLKYSKAIALCMTGVIVLSAGGSSTCFAAEVPPSEDACEVKVQVDSSFSVKLPKHISSEVDNTGTINDNYTVKVIADLRGDEKLTVRPDAEISFVAENDTPVQGKMMQEKTVLTYEDIKAGEEAIINGTITANGLHAGEWQADTSFHINLSDIATTDIVLTKDNFYMLGIPEDETDVVIPATFVYDDAEYKVVGLDSNLFMSNQILTSLVLPNTITVAPTELCRNCPNLTTVDFGGNVKRIGSAAFSGCDSLIILINSESIECIEESAFYGAGITTFDFKNVTSIKSSAFACSKLQSVELYGHNFSDTSYTAFMSSMVKEVTLHFDDLREDVVVGNIFNDCENLSAVNIVGATYIPVGIFMHCTNLKDITVPEGCKEIKFRAFYASGIENIDLPDSLKTIEEYAFCDCDSLEVITIPDNVTEISGYCFSHCGNLKSINWGNSKVETIDKNAFENCRSVEELIIPDTVKRIENLAFKGMQGVKNKTIKIPASVEYIGTSGVFFGVGNAANDNHDSGFFTAFEVDPGNTHFKVNSGSLYTTDGRFIALPNNNAYTYPTFVMADGTTQLNESSFGSNYQYSGVKLADSYIVEEDAKSVHPEFLNYGNSLHTAVDGYNVVARYEVKDTNPNYSAVNGLLLTKDGTELVSVPKAIKDVVVPEGVKKIRRNSFWDNKINSVYAKYSYWKTLEIPSTIEEIDTEMLTFINSYSKQITITVKDNDYYYVNESNQIVKK